MGAAYITGGNVAARLACYAPILPDPNPRRGQSTPASRLNYGTPLSKTRFFHRAPVAGL